MRSEFVEKNAKNIELMGKDREFKKISRKTYCSYHKRPE